MLHIQVSFTGAENPKFPEFNLIIDIEWITGPGISLTERFQLHSQRPRLGPKVKHKIVNCQFGLINYKNEIKIQKILTSAFY